MHPAIENATGLFGRKRFYAPGQHPATYRYRQHLALLKKLPQGSDRDAAIEHIEGLIALFEEGHSEDKARFARVMGL